MVAKGFLAAAAIIICCSTTLQGKDPEEKCASGDCPAACSDQEKCRVEKTVCDDAKCDDKEECCEKEQVSLETIAKEKCATEKCSTEKCATQKCSAGECAKSQCAAEKSATASCSSGACSIQKCTAVKGGEKCAFTTTLGGLSAPLRCALEATPVSFGVSVRTCSQAECAASTEVAGHRTAAECNGESCPVAACASQVCDALQCAIESCTASTDQECCPEAVCATGACGTSQCAALQCSEQACPLGKCETACSSEVNNGLKCAVEACFTATGGQFTITAAKAYTGEPVSEKCSAEACAEKGCSTATCANKQCAATTCSTSKCASSKCSTEVCKEEICATTKCNAEKCSLGTCSEKTCAASDCSTGKCVKSVSLEDAAEAAAPLTACTKQEGCASAFAERKLTEAVARLEAKIAAIEQRHAEVGTRRVAVERAQMYVVEVKVVEVNKSKCRNLGFDFEVAGGNAACEFVGQTLDDLMKRNLAHVLFNPTLCVTSDRPASFRSGAEIAPKIAEGMGMSGFVGKKVDLVASPAGENKVRLHIAPAMSELDFAMQDLPRIRTIKWDFDCEATLGKPMVLKGADEQRHVSKTVEGREPFEDIEFIETMLIVTVNSIDSAGQRGNINQAAYEASLLEKVQEPTFVTKVYPVPDLQVWKVRPQGVQFDADLLIAHVKATVDPQSWRGAACASPADAAHADGAIQPFERNGSLVICQTEANHERIAKLFQQMRTEGQRKDEERKLRDGGVTPASAEAPVEQESKCSKGECSEEKCPGKECSKSEVSLESESADECPGKCADGACQGECPETASCPCIGGACTR